MGSQKSVYKTLDVDQEIYCIQSQIKLNLAINTVCFLEMWNIEFYSAFMLKVKHYKSINDLYKVLYKHHSCLLLDLAFLKELTLDAFRTQFLSGMC